MPPSKQHIHAFLEKKGYGIFKILSKKNGKSEGWLSTLTKRGVKSLRSRQEIVDILNKEYGKSYEITDFIW